MTNTFATFGENQVYHNLLKLLIYVNTHYGMAIFKSFKLISNFIVKKNDWRKCYKTNLVTISKLCD